MESKLKEQRLQQIKEASLKYFPIDETATFIEQVEANQNRFTFEMGADWALDREERISVEYQTPPVLQEIICCIINKRVSFRYFSKAYEKYTVADWIDLANVSWWKPLPNPPQS